MVCMSHVLVYDVVDVNKKVVISSIKPLVLSDNIDSSILTIKTSLSQYDSYSLLSRYCRKITRNIVTKFI